MSYARSPSEGDVYVVGTRAPDGKETIWQCLSCDIVSASFRPERDYGEVIGVIPDHFGTDSFCAVSPRQMIAHLTLHRAAGQTVPDRAFVRLAEEQVEWVDKRNAAIEEAQRPLMVATVDMDDVRGG